MWIVQLALRRPYTFVVMAVLILVLGVASIWTMSTDIFPPIDIPVVSVVWTYSGTSPDEMEKRFTTISERAMTTTVNDIEHIESQSVTGVSVIKIFFQPGVKVEAAVAQITAVNQTILRILPPGTTPPFVLQFSASNVPILQAVLTSNKLSEADLYDLGLNFVRTQLATVQGAQVPSPYGGKARQIMVDLDPAALYAKNLSPTDVVNALTAQNLILAAGDAKVGNIDYTVRTNASPQVLTQLNDIPVRQVNGATVYMRDVAQVHEGFAPQQSIVRVDGRRAALMTILKAGNASTLDIVARVRARLPAIIGNLPPPQPQIKLLFDQSVFVRAALQGVVKEALIAATLTAIMILLFLGSWRSTVIIAVSIPLSILVSIIVLDFTGHTLNTMTLGGLGLAVGILVDDATVEIENIHRNLGLGKQIEPAILDGAAQIAVPAFVSTLAICIVFVPVVFLSGAAKSLFTPLALAVVFAMLASYLLSRTLVPTMVKFLLAKEVDVYALAEAEHSAGHRPELRRSLAEVERKRRGLGFIWRVRTSPLTGCLRGCARVTSCMLEWCLANTTFHVDAALVSFLLISVLHHSLYRTGLLSGRGCGQLSAARACACGHEDRGDRSRSLKQVEAEVRRDDSGKRAERHHRRHRCAEWIVQPGLWRRLADGRAGWRNSCVAERRSPTQRRDYRAGAAQGACVTKFPEETFYFQASGYREPDSQLRTSLRRSTSRSAEGLPRQTTPRPQAISGRR